MKRSLFFICILILAQCVGQRFSNGPLTKRQEKRESENHNCVETTAYSLEERMRFYPFDKAVLIRIVSFDSGDSALIHTLPMKDGEIDFTRIKEEKTLNKEQLDGLTNIFYNVSYKGDVLLEHETGCYNPRNAILFYDSSNHLQEFIELCFECSGSRLSSDKIILGDWCDQKYSLLKQFFLKAGIEIGTIKEVR